MKIARALILTALALSAPVHAETMREVNAAELRQAARTGDILSLKRVIESVTKSIGGEAIEARAFEADELYYRLVLKKPNGSVVSIIINAQTGEQVSKGSAVGRQVAAAAETESKTKGKGQTAGENGKAGEKGNSGGNGNGGGNGGGGGNGNGGGNGKN